MYIFIHKAKWSGCNQDDSELGESILCAHDRLCSSWRQTHIDIISTLPSSFDAMKG